jgi:hypothetical protein
MIPNFFNRVVSECESVREDIVVSNNELDNEYFKDLHDIDKDSFVISNDHVEVESYQVMLSNMVTAFTVPHSNSSNTDILLSNITGESELESDNSISLQRRKELKSLFKTIYADFFSAGNSS